MPLQQHRRVEHRLAAARVDRIAGAGAPLGRLKLTGLADTMRKLQRNGPRDYYEGEVAREVRAAIVAAAHAAGARVLLDVYHSLGVLPVVTVMNWTELRSSLTVSSSKLSISSISCIGT